MKKIFTLITILLLSICAFSQSKYGHLTIVSEDNEPFFLYLNGVQYNNNPLTVIRIEELSERTYNCKIVYNNKRLATVIVDRLQVSDYEGYMQDITYLLSTKRRGAQALMVYQILPLDNMDIDYDREELYIWGRPGRPYRQSSSTHRAGSHRTRKPTFRESDRRRWDDDKHRDRERDTPKCLVMQDRDFSEALKTIKNTTMDDSKYEVAISILKFNCFTTDQIISIMEIFSFESTKLKFAKYAYASCFDPQNYFKVINEFSFSSSKEELSNYIKGM